MYKFGDMQLSKKEYYLIQHVIEKDSITEAYLKSLTKYGDTIYNYLAMRAFLRYEPTDSRFTSIKNILLALNSRVKRFTPEFDNAIDPVYDVSIAEDNI